MAFSCSNRHYNDTTILKMLERCNVSPPPNSVPTTSLPLTFFDIPWLLFPPTQSLFFYDFPQTTIFFTENTVPLLKHTLSLALQLFFPFCGSLSLHSSPEIVYRDGDFVSLTVAESVADFNHLCSNNPRSAFQFHDFVPELHPIEDEQKGVSLLALQITLFPENGFCVGLCYRNVVGDARTLDNFLKYWAYLSRLNGLDMSTKNKCLPSFDRSIIKEPHGVKESFSNTWRELKIFQLHRSYERLGNDLVRATYIVGPKDMEKIKNYIVYRWDKINAQNSGSSLLLSPYVVVCALTWASLMKARGISELENDTIDTRHHFGFIAGGITRLGYEVPVNYFGNCVAFGRSTATRKELLGEDGIVMAAKVIGEEIKELNEDVLGGVRKWMSDWKGLLGSELHVTVSGSPKVEAYGLDFGWGRAVKIEDISIDGSGAISLLGGREKGEIEVGLSLPRNQMDIFGSTFTEALNLGITKSTL